MSTACYRSVGLALSVAAFAAAGAFHVDPASAQDASFGSAVDQADLAEHRAGTLIDAEEIGEAMIAQSEQTVVGNSSDNTVNANSADGGEINISDDAFRNSRGMINTTLNSGPNALVQGVMSLTIILNE